MLVWALAQRPDATAAVLARLDGADADLRCVLVRLLGKTHEPAAVPALTGLLADPEPRVVASAVRALVGIGAPESAAELVSLLGRPIVPDADLLDAIVAAGAASLDPLADAAASPSPHVRAAAVEALGRLGASSPAQLGAPTHALLRQRLADPDAAVRLAALVGLGGIPDARADVEAALDDPELAAVARRLLDLHAT